jgi:hypothetical protein
MGKVVSATTDETTERPIRSLGAALIVSSS